MGELKQILGECKYLIPPVFVVAFILRFYVELEWGMVILVAAISVGMILLVTLLLKRIVVGRE